MIDCRLAPNPGPMTLDGTNTYILGDPARPRVVVDPGPEDQDHLAALIADTPAGMAEIWLTHHHDDHLAAVPELARRTGALVRSWWTPRQLGVELINWRQLTEGELPYGDDQRAQVIHIPGHTSDSVGFVIDGDRPVLLTGDMVLGRGTTVITYPDGDLGSYFSSLQRMRELVDQHQIVALLPGHGPQVDDPGGVLDHYRVHRLQRLDQVRAALASGARGAEEVVDLVYADTDPRVRQAAVQSVRSQLDYLDAS